MLVYHESLKITTSTVWRIYFENYENEASHRKLKKHDVIFKGVGVVLRMGDCSYYVRCLLSSIVTWQAVISSSDRQGSSTTQRLSLVFWLFCVLFIYTEGLYNVSHRTVHQNHENNQVLDSMYHVGVCVIKLHTRDT